MINIRPVSDLRNKFPEIEETVLRTGEPVYLTKNGYGSMVVMSIEQYSALTDDIELKLDEALKAERQKQILDAHAVVEESSEDQSSCGEWG